MCYTGKCKYEQHSGDCGLVMPGYAPDDALCVINEKEIERIEQEKNKIVLPDKFKEELFNLIISAEYVNMWLSAALDDPKVCEEMKGDIRRWLENLFEFKKKYDVPEITLYRSKINLKIFTRNFSGGYGYYYLIYSGNMLYIK